VLNLKKQKLMCHVLVVSDEKFTKSEKREFQELKRLEIRQQKTNPVIMFVYTNNNEKKSQKVINNYLKKHPHAITWDQKNSA